MGTEFSLDVYGLGPWEGVFAWLWLSWIPGMKGIDVLTNERTDILHRPMGIWHSG